VFILMSNVERINVHFGSFIILIVHYIFETELSIHPILKTNLQSTDMTDFTIFLS